MTQLHVGASVGPADTQLVELTNADIGNHKFTCGIPTISFVDRLMELA